MTAIVEMFREAAAPGGRNRFSCPLQTWELLWELGRAFGWTPRGTTYVVPAKSTVEAPARRNYQPGSECLGGGRPRLAFHLGLLGYQSGVTQFRTLIGSGVGAERHSRQYAEPRAHSHADI
jgi:hypothetical protein